MRTSPAIRFRVSIMPSDLPCAYSHTWLVTDELERMDQIGFAHSREAAWKLALATLRGMIALARIRKAAS